MRQSGGGSTRVIMDSVHQGTKTAIEKTAGFLARLFTGHAAPQIHQQPRAENQRQVQGTSPRFLAGPHRHWRCAGARWATRLAWKNRATRWRCADNLHLYGHLYQYDHRHHRRRQAPHHQERANAAFSRPCVPARLPAGDEYPAGPVAPGWCGRVAGVALHVRTVVVRGACGRPARRGSITALIGS
jgi:hypothetical protein